MRCYSSLRGRGWGDRTWRPSWAAVRQVTLRYRLGMRQLQKYLAPTELGGVQRMQSGGGAILTGWYGERKLFFLKAELKKEKKTYWEKTHLPARLKICCGPGRCHGCGATPRPPWMWPSCHWYSRPRSCLCWQFWRHKICCWGSLRSHLLPGSEGGGAESTQELRAVQFRGKSNHSKHLMGTQMEGEIL